MPNGDHRQSQQPGQHTQQRMSQGGDMSAAHRQSEFNDPHGKILNIYVFDRACLQQHSHNTINHWNFQKYSKSANMLI